MADGSRCQVYNLLASRHALSEASGAEPCQPVRRQRKLQFLGHGVCVSGLSRILGIGTHRASKMRQSINAKQECPGDGRFAKAKCYGDGRQTHKREVIHDFLTYLYTQVSEAMPEVASDRLGGRREELKLLRFSKLRGKRPRVATKRDRPLVGEQSKAVRLLPPGNYTDYLRCQDKLETIHEGPLLLSKENIGWT